MSADTATPAGSAGSVGGRYQLIECVAGDPEGPAVAWRGWDTVLNRPVTLTVVRPGGPAAAGFLAHAHAVSSIAHPALARVYDAVDEDDRAYVVSEWVTGTPFTALLHEGALDPDSAASTVARVADGIAVAHGAGIAFGGVHPDHVVVTADGGVKLAQVVGDGRAVPADDVRGLGALLYAALTAHWPLAATGGAAVLRPATTSSGHLLTPRQVRAGVPEDLSALAVRALDAGGPHGLHSAAGMVTVLSERAARSDDVFALDDDRRDRRRPRWVAAVIPAAAGLSVLALLGWLVGSALGGLPGREGASSPSAEAATRGSTTSPAAASPVPVKPQGATLVDPDGDGAENEGIEFSYDGDDGTSWETQTYNDRSNTFGGLKEGMGIAYDFGRTTSMREVRIVTDRPGIAVQILATDTLGSDPTSLPVVGRKADVQKNTRVPVDGKASARYYIVWITQLTPNGEGRFYGSLSEVSFLR